MSLMIYTVVELKNNVLSVSIFDLNVRKENSLDTRVKFEDRKMSICLVSIRFFLYAKK